jgi:hypothetical protein
MSASSVPDRIKQRLWGIAAGRCEYAGCNRPLWLDPVTERLMNASYVAHIIADEPGGPRGDVELSPKLRPDLSNIMLLCDPHHRLIDIEDVAGHSVERLRVMKTEHEERLAIVGAIDAGRKSHIVLYGANVGPHAAPMSYEEAARALVPEWYPAEGRAIALGMRHSLWTDADEEFWRIECEHLDRAVGAQLRPRFASGEIRHLSLFGFAPQPLLMRFGYLVSDIPAAETYQLHREPTTWRWRNDEAPPQFEVLEPKEIRGAPALIFSVSGRIHHERATDVIANATVWELVSTDPHNDVLQTREQLASFRRAVRRLLARIVEVHGSRVTAHVFPALPVSAAIEVGRVIQPKCAPLLHLYNQNDPSSGFTSAFILNPEQA